MVFLIQERLQVQSLNKTLIKIKLLANEAINESGPPPNFQIMVVNGQLEVPIGTVLLEFEVADFMLKENFIIMKNLPNPLNGLCFLRRNNAMFDVTQGILTFPYLQCNLNPMHKQQYAKQHHCLLKSPTPYAEKTLKKQQNEKTKTQTTKTVPNKTLKNDQCR